MNWVWFIGGSWIAVGTGLAMLIGRSIYLANQKAAGCARDDATVSTVVPGSTAMTGIDNVTASVRGKSTPKSSGRSPFIAGCVAPSERAPSEHGQGVL